MKISVITPTIRLLGLELVKKSLSQQSFRDFEWIVGSKEDPNIPEAKWVQDDYEAGFWSLNRIYNKMIQEASGELLVSWQDWIWAPPVALESFWLAHEQHSNALISGVGDQYERVNKYGKPEIKIWSDPRKRLDLGSFYEINFCDIEWNFCAVPRKALFDIGGFDEQMDFLGFGMDGYQVNERLNDAGYHFFIDQANESLTIRHGREDYGGQAHWDANNNIRNGQYQLRRETLQKEGKWPHLDFLKSS